MLSYDYLTDWFLYLKPIHYARLTHRLKIEAVSTFEKSEKFYHTQRYTPEDSYVHF